MARTRAGITNRRTSSILEDFTVFHQTVTSVTTTAEAIPGTNLSGRKGMFIQNLTSSDVYIGGCKPELLAWSPGFLGTIDATRKHLIWTDSPTKTGEYYATKPGGGDPGLEETLIAYAVLSQANLDSKTETLLTNGTVGSLNDHEWDWGDNDSLSFSTVYFKDATGDPDGNSWFSFISYWRVPDGSSSYGLHLGENDSMFVTADGSVRVFAYASATSNIVTVEV